MFKSVIRRSLTPQPLPFFESVNDCQPLQLFAGSPYMGHKSGSPHGSQPIDSLFLRESWQSRLTCRQNDGIRTIREYRGPASCRAAWGLPLMGLVWTETMTALYAVSVPVRAGPRQGCLFAGMA